ncbi:MAG: hypothetical protein JOZ25_11015 [Actinobacteria bacterium]|nr:hypothetical protein [Actinomycetota bacterium]
MALARVVTFEGVDQSRVDAVRKQITEGGPPEGFPQNAEIIVLHDADQQKALAVLLLESEEDYRKAHEILDAMPGDNTPGNRTSVEKYEVAVRNST